MWQPCICNMLFSSLVRCLGQKLPLNKINVNYAEDHVKMTPYQKGHLNIPTEMQTECLNPSVLTHVNKQTTCTKRIRVPTAVHTTFWQNSIQTLTELDSRRTSPPPSPQDPAPDTQSRGTDRSPRTLTHTHTVHIFLSLQGLTIHFYEHNPNLNYDNLNHK